MNDTGTDIGPEPVSSHLPARCRGMTTHFSDKLCTMPFNARVFQVFLASPSDTQTEREVLRNVIGRWNDLHAADLGVVLLPVGWETHAVPQLGEPPQALINRQVLERCDLLIGVFWTRLGTPTETAPSGTVEEIRRFVAAGKWALVYFSNRPAAPELLDADQLSALKQFQEELQPHPSPDRPIRLLRGAKRKGVCGACPGGQGNRRTDCSS